MSSLESDGEDQRLRRPHNDGHLSSSDSDSIKPVRSRREIAESAKTIMTRLAHDPGDGLPHILDHWMITKTFIPETRLCRPGDRIKIHQRQKDGLDKISTRLAYDKDVEDTFLDLKALFIITSQMINKAKKDKLEETDVAIKRIRWL